MKVSFFFLLLLFFPIISYSQYFDTFECQVSKDGKILSFPFTGGFDSPQFTETDINNDGLLDIYVFDRNGSVSSVFLRENNNSLYPYRFTKEFNIDFPKSLAGFSTIIDFNGDGLLDIFSSAAPFGAAGVVLFQAQSTNDGLSYTLRRMGRPQGDLEILWNNFPAGQVYNASTDIPAIVDVDSDGDLDILTFDEAGSYVYFCKNSQVEKALPSDTMDFMIEDYCFGKFLESGLSQSISLSSDPLLCANSFKEEDSEFDKSSGAHSGSSLLAFDPDLDNDYDLLIGDLTYNGLVFLENGGTQTMAFMTKKDNAFPSYDTSVDMPIFLSAFKVDVDNDGLQDILVSPNGQGSIRNVDNIWYYKNTGDADEPFAFMQKDYLAEETLDFGSYSVPSVVDYNSDGLMDIIIGAGGPFDGIETVMQLVLLENIGSSSDPKFKLVDEDYLKFSDFASTSSNPAPCFGDLDSDNDLDMLIGDESGKLYYFENIAGPGNTFEFAQPIYNWMGISSGQRIRPQLFDFNKDGLLDLIIGERNTNGYTDPVTNEFVKGNLNYYQNQGTSSDPMFDPDVNNLPNNPALAKILVSFSESSSAKGGASPNFYSLADKTYALVGSISGRISFYEIPSADPSVEAILIDDRFGGLVEGFYSAPVLNDLNNDGIFEMLIGNSRGGIGLFTTKLLTDFSSDVVELREQFYKVFPNPSDGLIKISSVNADIKRLRLIDLSGVVLYEVFENKEIDLSAFESGIYLLEITGQDKERTLKKIILMR